MADSLLMMLLVLFLSTSMPRRSNAFQVLGTKCHRQQACFLTTPHCIGRRKEVTSLQMAIQPPPLTNARGVALSWKEVAKRAAAGCTAAFLDGKRRVSVDIPQISSVDRSTTAKKFEDDNNFLLAVIEIMGGGKRPEPVGLNIQIMQGGFEGGGDYLSDEGLYGYRWTGPRGMGTITAIGNSEIDSSALKKLNSLDDGSGKVLLFNTNLDRLSFFDKIGMPKLDDVATAYVLRRTGSGFVSRQYPEDFALWSLDGDATGGRKSVLVAKQKGPFQAGEAEMMLRNQRQ